MPTDLAFGEDDIAWWHPRATGFADRRPIPGIEG